MAQTLHVRRRFWSFPSLMSGKRVTGSASAQGWPRARRLRVEPFEARRLLSLGDLLPSPAPPIENPFFDSNPTAPQPPSVNPQLERSAGFAPLAASSPGVDVYTAVLSPAQHLVVTPYGNYDHRYDDLPLLTTTIVADGSPIRLSANLQLTNFGPTSASWFFRFSVDGSSAGYAGYLDLPAGPYEIANLETILTGVTPGTHTVTVQGMTWTTGNDLRVDYATLNVIEFNAVPDVGPGVDVYTAVLSPAQHLVVTSYGNYDHRYDNLPSFAATFVADGSPVRLSANLQLTNFGPTSASWFFRFSVDGSPAGYAGYLELPAGPYDIANLETILTGLTPGTHTVTVQGMTWNTGNDLRVDYATLNVIEFNPLPTPRTDEEVYVPEQKGDSTLALRRNGDTIELVLAGKKPQVLWQGDVATVGKLTIYGARAHGNGLTIDLAANDFSGALPRGLVFDSVNQKKTDWLTIRGAAGPDTFAVGAGFVAANSLDIQLRGVEKVTLDGREGDDQYRVSGLSTKTVLADNSGTDTLDFSQATAGVSINLNKRAGQAQKVFVNTPNTLALRGTLENVIGTPQADVIRGNAAANRIEGLGGDDWLYGEAGNDFLYGGAGNNVLLGGAGNDLLDVNNGVAGPEGRNVLIGGAGGDTLQGGLGEEILIGGATRYDNKAGALAAVIREWTSTGSYQQRCDRLLAGFRDTTAGWVQLYRKDKASPKGTVLDDRTRDSLFGGAGDDWLFDFATDQTG